MRAIHSKRSLFGVTVAVSVAMSVLPQTASAKPGEGGGSVTRHAGRGTSSIGRGAGHAK